MDQFLFNQKTYHRQMCGVDLWHATVRNKLSTLDGLQKPVREPQYNIEFAKILPVIGGNAFIKQDWLLQDMH